MTTPAAGRGRGLKGSGVRNSGVGSWIARRARRTPDRIAVLHGDDRLTYAQLHDRVTRLAHGLRGLGVRRGDRVAYLGPNHPAFLETLFAAGTLGAILVPLNTRLAAPELARHLADWGTRTAGNRATRACSRPARSRTSTRRSAWTTRA